MNKPFYTLFTLFFSFFALTVSAQPCRNYACVINKVSELMFQNSPNYKLAFETLDSAEVYRDKKLDEIQALRRQIFFALNDERLSLKSQKEQTDKHLSSLNAQKYLLDSLVNADENRVIILEKQKAAVEDTLKKSETERKKALEVLDKLYFYKGKFGIAYNEVPDGYSGFGYVDRNLNVKIPYNYDEPGTFGYSGFAKSMRDGVYYLLDTLGNEYHLSNNIRKISNEILALDLENHNLRRVPRKVYNHEQIRIIKLSNNRLRVLSPKIKHLKRLGSLDLSLNHLKSLPSSFCELKGLYALNLESNLIRTLPTSIGKLTNLKILNLKNNEIPLGEKKRIRKALPNCKVIF